MNENNQPIVIIYHTPCNDGMTGAWAAVAANKDAELRPAMHGKPFPLDGLGGRRVIFVDICPTFAALSELLQFAKHVTILDHHKTAEADLKPFLDATPSNLTIVFDMNRSGAGIAWDYFHSVETRPWLVDVVEDNDLWRFANPHGLDTKALIEAIRSYPSDIPSTRLLAGMEPSRLQAAGEAILRFKTIQVQQSVEFAQRINFNVLGYDHAEAIHPLYISNVPFFLCSDVANKLAEKNAAEGGMPIGITYYKTANGKWALSFRTLGDFDCSAIAKRFGGGGHKNASGANVDVLPW